MPGVGARRSSSLSPGSSWGEGCWQGSFEGFCRVLWCVRHCLPPSGGTSLSARGCLGAGAKFRRYSLSPNAAPAKLRGPACPCLPGWLGPRQTDTRLRGKSLCVRQGKRTWKVQRGVSNKPAREVNGDHTPLRPGLLAPLLLVPFAYPETPFRALSGSDRPFSGKMVLVFSVHSLCPRWPLVKYYRVLGV